jgi:ubiquinone/menaquinone biosynthesis C-methylase UbiE
MQKKKLPKSIKESKTTSWGKVDEWYDDYVEDPESYHQKVVEPNLVRIVGDISGKNILDLGCGQGYFCRLFAKKGATVSGVDVSPELIEKANQRSEGLHIRYVVSPAEDLFSFAHQSQDIVVSVLATQNMRELDRVIAEVKRILKDNGRLILILNHPSFRVPQDSDWYYNPESKKQGRVVTRYMSEATVKIDMHPGSNQKTFTYSFHRPLQVFVKWLAKNNLAITRLEEWISHKESAQGPKKAAEDKARKEIPLFMCIEARLLIQ